VYLILRHNPSRDDYVNCAELCERLDNHETQLAIGLEGSKKYDDRAIIQNIVRAAKKCGKMAIAEEYEKRL